MSASPKSAREQEAKNLADSPEEVLASEAGASSPNVSDISASKADCLAELDEADRQLAMGTIKDADKIKPLLDRYRAIVNRLS
jgi:hypothetical protein